MNVFLGLNSKAQDKKYVSYCVFKLITWASSVPQQQHNLTICSPCKKPMLFSLADC